MAAHATHQTIDHIPVTAESVCNQAQKKLSAKLENIQKAGLLATKEEVKKSCLNIVDSAYELTDAAYALSQATSNKKLTTNCLSQMREDILASTKKVYHFERRCQQILEEQAQLKQFQHVSQLVGLKNQITSVKRK